MNKTEAFTSSNSNGVPADANTNKRKSELIVNKEDKFECGPLCKVEKKELEDEVITLRKKVEQLTRLNHSLQEDVIAKFKAFPFQQFAQANNPVPNDDDPVIPPVATRRNGQVHLGRDVWIPIQIFDSISSKKATKDGLFIKDMAVAVFGELTLSRSSVTGAVSNRCLHKPKKPPLDPTKKMAIRDILRHRLEQRKESEENIVKILDTVNSTIAEKIQDLIRPPRRQRVADYDDSSQSASRVRITDGLPTTFLGLESVFEPPNKVLKILPASMVSDPSRIPMTFGLGNTSVVQDTRLTSNEGNSSSTDARFGITIEEIAIEEPPDDSLGRLQDPLSFRMMDGVTVKSENEDGRQSERTNPAGDGMVFVSDIAGSNNVIINETPTFQHRPISIPIQDAVIKKEPDESSRLNDSSDVTVTAQQAGKAPGPVTQNEETVPSVGTNVVLIDTDPERTTDDSCASPARQNLPTAKNITKEKRTLGDFTEEDMKNPQDALKFYRLATSIILGDDVLNKNRLLLERIKDLDNEVKSLRERISDCDENMCVRRRTLSQPSAYEPCVKRKAESDGERQENKTKDNQRRKVILMRRGSKP